MKKLSINVVLPLFAILIMASVAFSWANRVEIVSRETNARINLGGADDVVISNITLSASAKTISGSFNWSKKTVNNPGEIDQIFLAIERKVVEVVYSGVPGTGGVSKSFSFSVPCDIPTPGATVNLYVVMTPSRDVSQGRAHYELEGGGHRTSIATIKGYE